MAFLAVSAGKAEADSLSVTNDAGTQRFHVYTDSDGKESIMLNGKVVTDPALAKQIDEVVAQVVTQCYFHPAAKLANDLGKPAGGRGANGR